jgi:superfamily II DNA or RNA helicase
VQNAPVSIDGEFDTAIAAVEARLRELDGVREAATHELVELRAQSERAISDGGAEDEPDRATSWTPQRKVALFASLFRGREDVFPHRWEKLAKGKSGWAPRCDNEWKDGICNKPRVKCGECPNQAFPVPDEGELLRHLRGRHVMGVYPLLAGDMCRLLAIDLDERSWRADVTALREACCELGLVPAVERSRSGEGAHVWFFFSEPVQAALARRFGLMLLTDAMARSPTLGMASYDRLFPSQDTLPKGGFGNLIALPLQQEARQCGNTLFVDERLEPFEDQWSYLESLPRIAPARLQELVARVLGDGRVLGVPEEAEDSDTPWRPVRPLTERLAAAELPGTVSATLAQRLYVCREGLPPVLLDALRRLAAFSNPKFLELQAMRKSTALTPRVIACFEQAGDFLVLPRGCLEQLEELLAGLNIALELSDERTEGKALKARFTGELTARQEQAMPALLAHELGVLCAPPGIGKTVIATRLIADRARSTLVLVHRKPLLEQWVKRLNEFLDLDADEIGTIGGGRGKPTGKVDVAMVQSLARHKTLDQLLAGYGYIIVDECHHVPAVTTERVLQTSPARYVTGLTATPKRRDGHHPIITMQCGPVRHTIEPDATRSAQPLTLRVVRRDTSFDPATLPTDPSIQEVYAALATDERRSETIAKDTLELAAQGRCPIVLTERREHLEQLAARLADTQTLIVLHGDMRPTEHRAALEQLASNGANDSGGRVVLATGRYVGEGFDDPCLDTLLLAMPIAWKGTVVQYAGRLHRAHPGKHDALIYDYVDAELPVLRRMFAKRLRAYRSLGYELTEASGTR